MFLRLWSEVEYDKINFTATDMINAFASGYKWYPATKGGDYRKWYGNNEYVVDWKNNGENISKCKGSAIRNANVNFFEGLTWTGISSKALGMRYCPNGFVYLISGKGITGDKEYLYYTLAFCCSNVAYEILTVTTPVLSFEVGYIADLPLLLSDKYKKCVDDLCSKNIEISKTDWDSFETSWDFKKHSLI